MTNPSSPPLVKPPIRDVMGEIPQIEIYDVGAMAEGPDRYEALVTQELAHVTGFEPNPEELAKLQTEHHPRKTYHPHFLGRGGPATFYVTKWPGCCSLFEPDPAVIDLFTAIGTVYPDNFCIMRTMPVETKRLDDIPGLPKCDYLKIDVQGGELDILEHATNAFSQAVVLEVEVEFLPIYKNQPLFGEISTFLRGKGFVLNKFIDVGGRAIRPFQLERNAFEPVSQLLWGDAIFVRDYTQLGAWTNDQLLKAAAILYEVYCSHDLAHHLLVVHDRRTGGTRAAHFLKALGKMPSLPLMYMTPKLNP